MAREGRAKEARVYRELWLSLVCIPRLSSEGAPTCPQRRSSRSAEGLYSEDREERVKRKRKREINEGEKTGTYLEANVTLL